MIFIINVQLAHKSALCKHAYLQKPRLIAEVVKRGRGRRRVPVRGDVGTSSTAMSCRCCKAIPDPPRPLGRAREHQRASRFVHMITPAVKTPSIEEHRVAWVERRAHAVGHLLGVANSIVGAANVVLLRDRERETGTRSDTRVHTHTRTHARTTHTCTHARTHTQRERQQRRPAVRCYKTIFFALVLLHFSNSGNLPFWSPRSAVADMDACGAGRAVKRRRLRSWWGRWIRSRTFWLSVKNRRQAGIRKTY